MTEELDQTHLANEDADVVNHEKDVVEQEVIDIELPVAKKKSVEFDWNISKKGANQYSKEKTAELQNMYDSTFRQVEDSEIVSATVTGLTDSDVILNIGFKSDGMIPRSEFKDLPDLKIGDEVDVYVESKENKKGALILSRKKAKLTKAWDLICEAHEKDIIVKGKVISKTKGGLIVELYGMETFLPGSQIDVKPITDYDQFVGKTMELLELIRSMSLAIFLSSNGQNPNSI